MKIVVAPDSFKESLAASAVCGAIARGLHGVDAACVVVKVPMADGGEGTVDALVAATAGQYVEAQVSGPLGDPVRARFGLLGDGSTAVIEMASASGLPLVPRDRRDPMRASTCGTGQLVAAALDRGVRRVILGIGGSATTDGGAGMAAALGYRLHDAAGRPIPPGGAGLARLDRIDVTARDPRLDRVEILVACDVDNPLTGPRGAAAVYGPQKGATPGQIAILDANLAHWADVLARDVGREVRDVPGSGAAGGLGAGLIACGHATLRRGIELVIEATRLVERLAAAQLCITAEGSIDASSAYGKTVVGVARAAAEQGVPVLALAGRLGPGFEAVLDQGVGACLSICSGPMTLDQAMAETARLLETAAGQALRLFRLRPAPEPHRVGQ